MGTQKTQNDGKTTVAESPRLRVLFCISEAQPFAAAGGLGEVGGSLPKALTGIDVRVVLPLYQSISADVRKKCTNLGHIYINFAYRQEYCGVFEYKHEGTTIYFIDNEKYFKRDNIYGYEDDGERFAFFSKAVLDSIQLTNFKPDIIHANDWHTAAAIIYLKTAYRDAKAYNKIKTLFTVHNIKFQGRFPYSFMTDVMNLDFKFKDLLEYGNQINLVKAAIQCADMVNTVSPTYAEEIKITEQNLGLGNCVGILNGIDYKF